MHKYKSTITKLQIKSKRQICLSTAGFKQRAAAAQIQIQKTHKYKNTNLQIKSVKTITNTKY